MMDKEIRYLWLGVSIGILGRIILGIILQQMMLEHELVSFGESLEGVSLEINVDLNETLIVEKVGETMSYILNEINEDNLEVKNEKDNKTNN